MCALGFALGCVEPVQNDNWPDGFGTEAGSLGAEESGSGDGEPGDADCASDGPWSEGYAIPPSPQAPGDPVVGRLALFERDYVTCGIPWSLWELTQPLMGSIASGERLAWRSGKNAQVPYSWNVVSAADGSEYVSPNCLQCHGGTFDGELVIGLGRVDLDMTKDVGTLLGAVPPLLPLTDAAALMNKFMARYAAIGPWSRMRTIGTNSAIMYAIALVNHRDPHSLAWLDTPTEALPKDVIIAADPPPWWRVRKRAGQFANGMSRGDHRGTMILASSLCTDTTADAAVIIDYFADINAYLATIEPPKYPRPIDASLAGQGEAIFECECSGCHGTYAEDPLEDTYPSLLIPLDVIGTDPSMASLAAGQFNYLESWFNGSYYGTVTTVATADPFVGYVAPPLDGIWASAPYFHNGSVPTIEQVLDSSKRPTYWRRVDYDSSNYDWRALGWPWVPAKSQAQTFFSQRKYVYDTTIMSHGNGGHTFGDELSDAQREAVIEYLKTL